MPSSATATQTIIEKDFYRIGEVSRLTNLKPFVLRYWETEFPMLEPVKSPSGHRLYRQEDVEMVLRIKRLLYDEGFTIAGARRHLRETNGAISVEPSARAAAAGAFAGSSHAAAEGSHGAYATASEHAHHPMTARADTDDSANHASHASHTAGSHAPHSSGENAAELLNRKMLLDLRDSLRGFLTLLERRGQ